MDHFYIEPRTYDMRLMLCISDIKFILQTKSIDPSYFISMVFLHQAKLRKLKNVAVDPMP